jgi:hypothetical protein
MVASRRIYLRRLHDPHPDAYVAARASVAAPLLGRADEVIERGRDAMKLPRRRFLQFAASAAALPAMSGFAWAQTYPTRPITMVVGFPAGGANRHAWARPG